MQPVCCVFCWRCCCCVVDSVACHVQQYMLQVCHMVTALQPLPTLCKPGVSAVTHSVWPINVPPDKIVLLPRYTTMMSGTILSLQQQLSAAQSVPPSSPIEAQFATSFLPQLATALECLQQPPKSVLDEPSTLPTVWAPIKRLHAHLVKELANTRMNLAQVLGLANSYKGSMYTFVCWYGSGCGKHASLDMECCQRQ